MSCRTILNKQEGGVLYQRTHDSRFSIPRPISNIYKQPGPTRITTSVLLWILLTQYTPHDIINAKRISYKMDIYWENGSGHSLPPNP